MDLVEQRKHRLHHLITLARTTRGWSRARLARALGRDPTKIYPESGNPKADFLMRLSEVLGWPIGDVMEMVWGDTGTAEPQLQTNSFDDLHQTGREAHKLGEYERLINIAKTMYRVAETDAQRAFSCAFEASGWDGLGRYMQEADAAQRGLSHPNLSPTIRNILKSDLANAWYSLWELTPALGTSELLVQYYEENPPTKDRDWKWPAYGYYVRGNTHRRLAAIENDSSEQHYRAAVQDLEQAAEMFDKLAVDLNTPGLAGIGNTVRGGIVESEVELKRRTPESAIEELRVGLETLSDSERAPKGDWLESYGWRCVFGANVAMRHLTGSDLQHAMHEFCNSALSIADEMDNWALRERVFTLQFVLHQRLSEQTGLDLAYTIDDEQQQLITATMGRFPNFRQLGWQILETAQIVGSG